VAQGVSLAGGFNGSMNFDVTVGRTAAAMM
jgi:hypothetical protein